MCCKVVPSRGGVGYGGVRPGKTGNVVKAAAVAAAAAAVRESERAEHTRNAAGRMQRAKVGRNDDTMTRSKVAAALFE